jgi:hypothetical protein
MQIQTTTITSETQSALGESFQITTYEQTTTAFCDCCPNQGTGTRKELERRGWYLGSREEFCPECN